MSRTFYDLSYIKFINISIRYSYKEKDLFHKPLPLLITYSYFSYSKDINANISAPAILILAERIDLNEKTNVPYLSDEVRSHLG